MNSAVRPHTKLAAAMLAAGVVSAGSLVALPEHRALPVISADVANASAITDGLVKFGDAVAGLAAGAGIPFEAGFSLPFDAVIALFAATNNTAAGQSVLSYLVQNYVNPGDAYKYYTYPNYFKDRSIIALANLLPAPLSTTIVNAVNGVANTINQALSTLPDPTPGQLEFDAFQTGTTFGNVVYGANLAVLAPVYMAWNTALYLGYLPSEVSASVDRAVTNPADVPGLISYLAHDLLSPDKDAQGNYVGLFGRLLGSVIDPLYWMPAPLGGGTDGSIGWARELQAAIGNVVNQFLAALPTPVNPWATAATTTPAAGQSTDANGIADTAALSASLRSALSLPSTENPTETAGSAESVSKTPTATELEKAASDAAGTEADDATEPASAESTGAVAVSPEKTTTDQTPTDQTPTDQTPTDQTPKGQTSTGTEGSAAATPSKTETSNADTSTTDSATKPTKSATVTDKTKGGNKVAPGEKFGSSSGAGSAKGGAAATSTTTGGAGTATAGDATPQKPSSAADTGTRAAASESGDSATSGSDAA